MTTTEQDDLEKYNTMHYRDVLLKAVQEFNPDVILGMASPLTRDFFPRVAARLDTGLLTDLVELQTREGKLLGGIKPMYAGKVLSQVEFSQGVRQCMVTLRPNSTKPKKTSGSANLAPLEVSLDTNCSLQTKELAQGEASQSDLTEAGRIISGGRAMGSADNFKILEECGEVISATVGASRAAVDSGYAHHSMQVGQTGKTVSPSLYIACGISGSIQHMAGMRTSKTVVAINKDPDAPIFSIADYGIIADLFEAVPVLTRKLKEKL